MSYAILFFPQVCIVQSISINMHHKNEAPS